MSREEIIGVLKKMKGGKAVVMDDTVVEMLRIAEDIQ